MVKPVALVSVLGPPGVGEPQGVAGRHVAGQAVRAGEDERVRAGGRGGQVERRPGQDERVGDRAAVVDEGGAGDGNEPSTVRVPPCLVEVVCYPPGDRRRPGPIVTVPSLTTWPLIVVGPPTP